MYDYTATLDFIYGRPEGTCAPLIPYPVLSGGLYLTQKFHTVPSFPGVKEKDWAFHKQRTYLRLPSKLTACSQPQFFQKLQELKIKVKFCMNSFFITPFWPIKIKAGHIICNNILASLDFNIFFLGNCNIEQTVCL